MALVKLFAMDVDGTLTDGKIYIGADGELMKAFDIKDGYAIYEILPRCEIVPVIITGRQSGILQRRCDELGISEVYQGCSDKRAILETLASKYGLFIDNGKIVGASFMGDDLLDIPAMEFSEFSGCPSDAAEEVKKVATYVCKNRGGSGAVREYAEWIIKQKRGGQL